MIRTTEDAKRCLAAKIEKLKRTFPERFWKRVVKSDTGCWNWIGSKTQDGYGSVRYLGIHKRCTHVVYEWYRTPVPNGFQICHTCDNPSCVNPAHLFIGTARDNVQDCIQKNRRRWNFGETHYRSKFTDAEILSMRKRFKDGRETRDSLAKQYKVHRNHITAILNGRRWAHLPV